MLSSARAPRRGDPNSAFTFALNPAGGPNHSRSNLLLHLLILEHCQGGCGVLLLVGVPGWPRRKQEGSLQEGMVTDLGLGFPRLAGTGPLWGRARIFPALKTLKEIYFYPCVCVYSPCEGAGVTVTGGWGSGN